MLYTLVSFRLWRRTTVKCLGGVLPSGIVSSHNQQLTHARTHLSKKHNSKLTDLSFRVSAMPQTMWYGHSWN